MLLKVNAEHFLHEIQAVKLLTQMFYLVCLLWLHVFVEPLCLRINLCAALLVTRCYN